MRYLLRAARLTILMSVAILFFPSRDALLHCMNVHIPFQHRFYPFFTSGATQAVYFLCSLAESVSYDFVMSRCL